MKPEDIRKFHRDHYFLANMGAVVSLPKGEPLAATLAHLDSILNRAQPAPVNLPALSEASLPAPQPAPAGSIQVVDFPFQNEQQPSYVMLAWPANRKLNSREELLLNLFLDNFAGDTSTNLYRLFINSKTRKMDIGAQGVFNDLREDLGFPVMIGFTQVAAANLNPQKVAAMREIVTAELARIAQLPDGSPELAEFNARVRSRVIEQRRQLSKLVNSPPGFGTRNAPAVWMLHLYRLNREPGFRKSVTLKQDNEAVEQMLAADKNVWRDLLPHWHLTGTQPFGIAARPSAALLKQEQQARLERAAAEVKKLESKYGIADEQEAIRRYQTEYEAESARLDQLAREASAGKFLENPPLTLDDQLEYRQSQLPGRVSLVTSMFDNMTSATTALALRLDSIPERDLPLVSLLPDLLTKTGVIMNGKPVPYEQMEEMLRKEVLSLQAAFETNVRTNRVELMVQGSGNDLNESRRAIDWMRLVLEHPDWRPENLPRIRDLVEQTTKGLRATMQGAEERWVRNPVLAYYRQTNPLYLASSSFLTRAQNADRLRWMLKDSGSSQDREAVSEFLALAAKAAVQSTRADLKLLLTALQGDSQAAGKLPASVAGYATKFDALPSQAKQIARDAADDLSQLLPDLPDGSLAADWSYLCNQMRQDLAVTPEKALARLNALRESLLNTGNARVWMVGSRANEQQLATPLAALVGDLKASPLTAANYPNSRRIDEKLRQRQPDAAAPRFVGLFNPNLAGGVMMTMIPFTSYDDTGRDALLDLLALKLFGGGGAHSVFTRTIGAGLAYSNGIGTNTHDGWAGYYAERMPEIPQTLHFVVDVVKKGPRDPRLSEYVIAQVFQDSNAAGAYEARAATIAADLTDGLTPEKVKRFRQAVLALRREPNLADEVFSRVDKVYGKIVPGYGIKAKDVPGAVYYMIGNEKQFAAMDADVQSREDEHVYRLYPRDYWLTPELHDREQRP